jgi:hypothetical protein
LAAGALVALVLAVVGCGRSAPASTGPDVVEFDGSRRSISAYGIERSFNETLRQEQITVQLRHDDKPIATLSLGLEGASARVVRAGLCVIYGNGVFQHGSKGGALCETGPTLVQAVRWQDAQSGSPQLALAWKGTLGPHDVIAGIEFDSIRVAQR